MYVRLPIPCCASHPRARELLLQLALQEQDLKHVLQHNEWPSAAYALASQTFLIPSTLSLQGLVPQCLCHLRADEAMTLEFQGTMVFGRQSRKLQSRRIDANTNPVPAPTMRASSSGTGPPPRLLATYSYSSFAPSSLHSCSP